MPADARATMHRWGEPRLAIHWQTRAHIMISSLRVLLEGPGAPRKPPTGTYFGHNWVLSPFPRRAVIASILWHIVLLQFPYWDWLLGGGHRTRAFESYAPSQYELTWDLPARDLPAIPARGPRAKPSPPGEPNQPLPPAGADAYHPRQFIISAPKTPTHPRQTLIQPDAPQAPPKILPALPNIVQWSDAPLPARPKLEINREALARLRPKPPARRSPTEVAVPDLPNQERAIGDVNLATSPMNVPKPQLPVVAASVPRLAQRAGPMDTAPAPDLAPDLPPGGAAGQRLIALSPNPGMPAMPVENLPIPSGNLSARFTISPEGAKPGAPGGSPNGTPNATGNAGGGPGSPGGTGGSSGTQPGTGGGGNSNGNDLGVTISGGNPNAASSISGLGHSGGNGTGTPPIRASLPAKPEARTPDPAPSFSAPAVDRVKNGAPPESIFGTKRVYTLHVNMPNLTSATGSWILSFVEIAFEDPAPALSAMPPPRPKGDLAAPVPIHKVDPRYPPSLMHARVEGEVVLYAIIRRDGSVDSIQVVKGVDPALDENAMQAFAKWTFHPAQRNGVPVELEAIVYIPFRAVAPQY